MRRADGRGARAARASGRPTSGRTTRSCCRRRSSPPSRTTTSADMLMRVGWRRREGPRPYLDLLVLDLVRDADRPARDDRAGRAHARQPAGRHPDRRALSRGRHADRHRRPAGRRAGRLPAAAGLRVKQYILRRLALAIPTLFLVSVIVFALMRLMPGDVVTRMVEGHGYAPTLDALRHDLGLDRPVLRAVRRVDRQHRAARRLRPLVLDAPAHPGRVRRGASRSRSSWPLLTILVSVVIGVVVGIVSAVRQDSVSDYVGRILAILALSVPYFGLAVLVVVLPSIYFKWTPVWTYVPFTVDPLENLKIMLVPALVFGVTRAGPIMRIMRSALLDVLRQDYIRTAWSKGLSERDDRPAPRAQERDDPGHQPGRAADAALHRRLGHHRGDLPAARRRPLLLRGAHAARLPGRAVGEPDHRGHGRRA